jgi:hypothetical protein
LGVFLATTGNSDYLEIISMDVSILIVATLDRCLTPLNAIIIAALFATAVKES